MMSQRLLGMLCAAFVLGPACGTERTCADLAGDALVACCADLSEGACLATEGCAPIDAWTKEQACAEGWSETLPEFVTCGPNDCTLSTTWARDPAAPDAWSLFSTGCLPPGWEGAASAGDPDPCVCRLSAEPGPSTHVIAALRVCDSPMLCGHLNGCSPFGVRAVYLYADGRLVSRGPTTWSTGAWFLVRTLTADELCGVADGVALDRLALQSGVSVSSWTDQPETEVYLEAGGVGRQASVYGDVFDADVLDTAAYSAAPDVMSLALQLDALRGGEPYTADTIELHARLATADHESGACTLADAPAWPFADVDLAAAAAVGPTAAPLTLTGQAALDVRAWVVELVSGNGCRFVKVGAEAYAVATEDVPPGGRAALPFGSCLGGQ